MTNQSRRMAQRDDKAAGWIRRLVCADDGVSPIERLLVVALCATVFGLFLLAVQR